MKGILGCVVALAIVAGSSLGAQLKGAEPDRLVQPWEVTGGKEGPQRGRCVPHGRV
jgi:hypothetical protein